MTSSTWAPELDIIEKRGSWYSYGDLRLGQGRENTKEYLQQNPELAAEVEKAVREQALTNSPAKPWSDEEEDFDDSDDSAEDEE